MDEGPEGEPEDNPEGDVKPGVKVATKAGRRVPSALTTRRRTTAPAVTGLAAVNAALRSLCSAVIVGYPEGLLRFELHGGATVEIGYAPIRWETQTGRGDFVAP
jgi:hypothetical protein